MLILHLLLVMIIGCSRASKPLTEDPSNCETMTCFITPLCRDSDLEVIQSHPLETIPYRGKIVDDCEAIVKIRSYSKNYYLIVLESYNRIVVSIKLEQGKVIFECARNLQTKIVSATYKIDTTDHKVDLKRHTFDKLMCEFFVRNDGGVFASPADEVKLYSNSMPPGITMNMDGNQFHAIVRVTCDPDAVQSRTEGAVVGGKTVSKVLVDFADLVCPVGQTLMYRNDDPSKFENAGRISCPVNQFQPALQEARCEVTTCTMCNSLTFPSTLEKIKDGEDGDCNKLKCPTGRIKIGSSAPIDGLVECEYVKPNHVWQINGQTITIASPVTCAVKKTCDAEVNKICSACTVEGGIPTCTDSTLKWSGLLVQDIMCNDTTGHLEIKIQGEQGTHGINVVKTLQCVDKDGIERRNGTETASASTGGGDGLLYGGIGAVVVLLVVVGAIVGFVFWRRSQQKRQAHPQFPVIAKPDAKSVTSKESKSNQSQKPSESNKDTPKPNEEQPAQPVVGLDVPKGVGTKSPAEIAFLELYNKNQEKMGKNGNEEQSAPENYDDAVGMLRTTKGDYTAANKNKN